MLVTKRSVLTGQTHTMDLNVTAEQLEALVSRIAEWTHQHGAELVPRGPDTYGDGVRDSKERVARMIEGDTKR